LVNVIVLLVFVLLVILPAAAAFFSESSFLPRAAIAPAFAIGARVVYQRQEVSTRPSADAHDIRPSERGEFYYCSFVNYLRVTEVLADGRIIAVARDNKRLCFWPNDSQFRKARLSERFICRWRFPHC
jgi:hypothetical protein